MENFGKKILEKIREENIRPVPRWHFLMKRNIIWSIAIVLLLLGSIASSIIIFQLKNTEWDIIRHYQNSMLEALLLTIPLAWFVLLAVLLFLTYVQFRHTPRGYRYNSLWIFGGSIALSIAIGSVVFYSGFSSYLENSLREHVPIYQHFCDRAAKIWMNPEQGLLMGSITEMNTGNKRDGEVIIFTDIRGKVWHVNVKTAVWRGETRKERNLKLRLIGSAADKNFFIAEEIRPWPGEGRRRR